MLLIIKSILRSIIDHKIDYEIDSLVNDTSGSSSQLPVTPIGGHIMSMGIAGIYHACGANSQKTAQVYLYDVHILWYPGVAVARALAWYLLQTSV